jgi:hypothetical protein
MRSVKSHLFVSGCIVASLCLHASAANLIVGTSDKGTIGVPSQSNSYSFVANAGDVFDFTMTATSGTLSPRIRLYNPTGTLLNSASPAFCNGSSIEMNTVLLQASGTYTLVAGDCSDTHTGDYYIYAQQLNTPSGAKNLLFGQTQSGNIGLPAESDSYTFSANVNDDVVFTVDVKSGSLSPKLRLYSGSNGTLLSTASPAFCNGSTIETSTIQIPATGTYTVLAGDCSDTRTGAYDIYVQRTDHPSGAANLPFGQTQTGTIVSPAESDTYTFSANAKDVVDFTMVTTSGTLSPKIRLYKPDGTLLNSASPAFCNGSSIEMNTIQIPAIGTYTVLVGDCSDTKTGTYKLYAQRTNNPSRAVNIPFGATQTGLIGMAAQSNTYTFSANANDVVDFTMVTTSGTLSPKIRLYRPDGTLLSSASPSFCNGSSIEMNTIRIPANGTYTVLVGDCSDTKTGNYNLYAQRTNNPSGAAPLLFGQTQTGTILLPAERDTYTFSANANNVVDFTMVTTSGTLSPKIRLYRPDGTLLRSVSPSFCNGSSIEMSTIQLLATGIYTVLAGDCSDTRTGSYNFSSQCFGACPVAPPITWPTPAPITYGTPLSAAQLNASSTVAGSFKYSPASGTVLAAGVRALSVTFTPADKTKYATATKSVQLTVNKAVLTVTASNATRVYGTANPTFGYTITGFVHGDTKSVVSGTPALSTPATVSSPVGTYPITAAMGTLSAANYTFKFVGGTLTITPVPPPAASPVFQPGAGTYSSVKSVTITDATPGAKIYYTTDGKVPTTSSTLYTGPITVRASQTIKAFAIQTGYTNSAVVSAAYMIIGSPSALAAPATSISTSGAMLNAMVNTFGLAGSYVFQYGTSSTALNTSTPKTALAASMAAVSVSRQLTGLTTRTTYYYRVVVTTTGGTGTCAVLSFTTN